MEGSYLMGCRSPGPGKTPSFIWALVFLHLLPVCIDQVSQGVSFLCQMCSVISMYHQIYM